VDEQNRHGVPPITCGRSRRGCRPRLADVPRETRSPTSLTRQRAPRTVNVPVTGSRTLLTEVATLLTDPAGAFPDRRSHQLSTVIQNVRPTVTGCPAATDIVVAPRAAGAAKGGPDARSRARRQPSSTCGEMGRHRWPAASIPTARRARENGHSHCISSPSPCGRTAVRPRAPPRPSLSRCTKVAAS
jgi:hypothetical protein